MKLEQSISGEQSSMNSQECKQLFANGEPDASRLALHLFNECYRYSARTVLVPEFNADALQDAQVSHRADDALTKAYMEVKDAVPLVVASDGKRQPEYASATIIDSSGLAVTNHHVVADGRTKLETFDQFGNDHMAKVLIDDPAHDLALLQIEKKSDSEEFPSIKLGSSQKLKSGDHLIAVGHPLKQTEEYMAPSLYVGFIRYGSIPHLVPFPGVDSSNVMIETDATVFPGNSGGVLVNSDSLAVGINAISDTVNKAYAIPIERVIELKNRWQADLKHSH